MFRMLKDSLRGGVSAISKRFAKANNKYMSQYNPSEPSSFIEYLDANNLYRHSMSSALPYGGFKWLDEAEWSNIDWLDQVENIENGYAIECDLGYPDSLHDSHNEYPLAPERM